MDPGDALFWEICWSIEHDVSWKKSFQNFSVTSIKKEDNLDEMYINYVWQELYCLYP